MARGRRRQYKKQTSARPLLAQSGPSLVAGKMSATDPKQTSASGPLGLGEPWPPRRRPPPSSELDGGQVR